VLSFKKSVEAGNGTFYLMHENGEFLGEAYLKKDGSVTANIFLDSLLGGSTLDEVEREIKDYFKTEMVETVILTRSGGKI
jgi:hypothetical protein